MLADATPPATRHPDENVADAHERRRLSRSPRRPPPLSARAQPRPGGRIPLATTQPALESTTGQILSIGVYISGNAGLEIGARYGLSRAPGLDGDRLLVFGPVDTGEITIRHEGPVDAFDVTGVDDRVIITGRDERSSLTCVFRALGGMRGADLERALSESPVSR